MPETRFPTTRTEVANLAPALSYPLLLKAIDGDRMVKLSRRRMVIVRSKDELLREYDEINDPPNLMLQNYIPGPEDNCWIFHAYFNHKSECLAAFTGRKIRQYHAYCGATSLGICAKNTVIAETSIRFLKEIGYCGLVDICVRFDARDGLYKVLDINPRIGANFRLFVSGSGCDLARMFYLDMTGQPCTFGQVREGRKWMVEDFDFLSCLRYWSDGNLQLRAWFASLSQIDEYGYLSLRDPLPVTARLLQAVVAFCRHTRVHGKPGGTRRYRPDCTPESTIPTAWPVDPGNSRFLDATTDSLGIRS